MKKTKTNKGKDVSKQKASDPREKVIAGLGKGKKGTKRPVEDIGCGCANCNPDSSKVSRPEGMGVAFEMSARVIREELRRESPEDLKLLETVRESDIIVISGEYDQVEDVLDLMGMPYVLIEPQQVRHVEFRPDQIVFVNCPGKGIGREGVENLKTFVEDGGWLLTTDWALKHVVQRIFPGTIRHDGGSTPDDCVRISVKVPDNPFVRGALEEGADAVWWLEGGSYPITVVGKKQVEVLIDSDEMEDKYKERPIAVRFDLGEGQVFHMTSHFYLQRAELRGGRAAESFSVVLQQKGMNYIMDDMDMTPDDAPKVGEVESAYSMQKMMTNIILEKKKAAGKK